MKKNTKNKNLLIEIGCEELPVSHQKHIIMNYASGPKLEGISHNKFKIYTTPRRIVFYSENVSERQISAAEKIFGPPKNAAFDKEGRPTAAAKGFAKSQGVRIEDLKIENKSGGEYVCVQKFLKGKDTISYLKETLPDFLHNIWFEKTMRWEEKGYKFSRPVRWILALYGDKVIKFKAFGLESSDVTYGNRLVANRKIEIGEADIGRFKEVLKKAYVIVDNEERKKIISDAVASGSLYEELADEVAGLTEYPRAIIGKFPGEYLPPRLPAELIRTCMMGHERFFPFEKNGLQPKFISISNNPLKTTGENIRLGNESVLTARLADSKYFYEQDIKENLGARLEKLKTIVFQGGMGSLHDKVNRLAERSRDICRKIPGLKDKADKCGRVALLCKIDTGSHVVNEFPSLQGTMGRIYALNFGEDKEVAQAIDDHYKPRFKNDMPEFIGAVVGIADRIDNICSFFAQGYKATGSEDPYGARRDAQSLIEVLMNVKDVGSIPIMNLIDEEMSLIAGKITNKNAEDEIIIFLKQRIQTFFKTCSVEYDEADAVMEIALNKNLRTAVDRAKVIQEFRKRADFGKFIIAFKRVVNILQQAEILKENALPECQSDDSERTEYTDSSESAKTPEYQKVNEELLIEEEEKKLNENYLKINDEVGEKVTNNNFREAMEILLANLARPIDDFFDHVMVMADDKNLKRNRLSLLYSIANLFFLIADFSKIVMSELAADKK